MNIGVASHQGETPGGFFITASGQRMDSGLRRELSRTISGRAVLLR